MASKAGLQSVSAIDPPERHGGFPANPPAGSFATNTSTLTKGIPLAGRFPLRFVITRKRTLPHLCQILAHM
jgi:hypothetical protein